MYIIFKIKCEKWKIVTGIKIIHHCRDFMKMRLKYRTIIKSIMKVTYITPIIHYYLHHIQLDILKHIERLNNNNLNESKMIFVNNYYTTNFIK